MQETGNYKILTTSTAATYSTYGNGSAVTSTQFTKNFNDAIHSLYQIIDNPLMDEAEKGRLYQETLAKLSSGLSATQAADMMALAVLHLLKYDSVAAGTLLSGEILATITTTLTSATDADGNHSPLAIAAFMATEKLISSDGIAMAISEDALRDIFTTEDGTEVTNPDNFKACLEKIQSVYTSMGFGANTVAEALIVEINDIPTAEEEAEANTTDYERYERITDGMEGFKEIYAHAGGHALASDLTKANWVNFLERLDNSLFDSETGMFTTDVWAAIETALKGCEAADHDNCLAGLVYYIEKKSGWHKK